MRYLPLLTLTLLCLLMGCEGTDSPTAEIGLDEVQEVGGSQREATIPINLDPDSLEKLSSWDDTSRASAELTRLLADIMSDIKDADSATAAIPKLKELAPKFAAVNRAEKAMGDPSKEDRTLVLKNLFEANQQFDAAYTPIVENEKLKEIVGEAIDDAYVGNVTE
ncbi:MAG: hypothetical protein AAFX06_07310 [Planctomycetota bacterium]